VCVCVCVCVFVKCTYQSDLVYLFLFFCYVGRGWHCKYRSTHRGLKESIGKWRSRPYRGILSLYCSLGFGKSKWV